MVTFGVILLPGGVGGDLGRGLGYELGGAGVRGRGYRALSRRAATRPARTRSSTDAIHTSAQAVLAQHLNRAGFEEGLRAVSAGARRLERVLEFGTFGRYSGSDGCG